jgi:hypothetical protein
MEFYVYVYYEDDTPIYVGKGKGNRYKVHLKKCVNFKRGKSPFYDKLFSMIEKGIEPSFRIVVDNLTEDEALAKEKQYCDRYGTIFKGTGTLYNYNECGVKNPILKGKDNPSYNKSIYVAWREKYPEDVVLKKIETHKKNLSKSLTGRKNDDETKHKMSKIKKDFWDKMSTKKKNEFRIKISESHTDERKNKSKKNMTDLNKKMSGKNHLRARKCLIEGVVYNTITEVCHKYGFKNHNTVRNRIKSKNFPEWTYL